VRAAHKEFASTAKQKRQPEYAALESQPFCGELKAIKMQKRVSKFVRLINEKRGVNDVYHYCTMHADKHVKQVAKVDKRC
jgi:hypothetical protein